MVISLCYNLPMYKYDKRGIVMFNRSEYQKEYRKKNLKRISLEVPNTYYETIKNHTEKTKEPVNTFIKRAINETMERDNK